MKKGFSLFELLVVIAIVAILSAIALPNYMSWRTTSMLNSAVFNLRADLQRAKLEAMKQRKNVRVNFSANEYNVFVDANYNSEIDPGELVFVRSLEGVSVDINDTKFGRFGYARFNSRGMSPGFMGHVTLISGNLVKKIYVDMVGRIRIA